MTGDVRNKLRVYSWARAQHILRAGNPDARISFADICKFLSDETGLELSKVEAVVAGGFSSSETQRAVAAWNGLKLAHKHGVPVLIVDRDANFDRGPSGSVSPLSVEEVRRRVEAHLQRGVAA